MHEGRAGRAVRRADGVRSAGAMAVLLAACGGSDASRAPSAPAAPGGSASESPRVRFERVVCPQCVEAGGETSDFGDGGAFMPGGAGVFVRASPCEESREASSIELDAALALGFGELLARLDASFDLPLDWSETEFDLDRPARGYSLHTRVRGTLEPVSVEHLVPSLDGCSDLLRVRLAATIETDDGALSIGGPLRATIERGTQRPEITGFLDLSHARGTLEIDPPPSSEKVIGYFRTSGYAWQDGVRLWFTVGVSDLDDVRSDSPSYFYEPVEARAPVDTCRVSDRPLRFDEATPTVAAGQSLADRYPELMSLITTPQPFSATWASGAETSLAIEAGQPLFLCDTTLALGGDVPYRARSSDGRVDIDSVARMQVSFTDGALGAGYFAIYEQGRVHPAQSFAESTGISGVDFRGLGAGFWHTSLTFDTTAAPPLVGELEVEGVDIDGHITGTPSAVVDEPLESLAW